MTRLLIVRHGDTFAPGQPPRRIGARTDPPLVESGRAQARALGRFFSAQALAFDRVLAAPLARTIETAALILGGQRHDAIEPADWLAEIDHGPDEGCPEAEVTARIGAAALAAWDRDATPPPGWIVERERRIADWRGAFADLRGTVLIVTSNGAARFAPIAAAAACGGLKLRTGAWGEIAVDDGAPRLVTWDERP